MPNIYNHNKNTVVLVDTTVLTSYLTDSDQDTKRKVHDVTAYGADDELFQGGLWTSHMKLKSFWVPAIHAVLEAAQLVTRGITGTAIGAPANFGTVFETHWATPFPINNIIHEDVDLQVNGLLDEGVWLHPLQAESAIGADTAVDNGAAGSPTTNGWAAVLHPTALTGTPTATILVEHSVDNSVWATLGTFAAVSAISAAQLLTGTGTVNRYVRARRSVFSGSGTLTYAVALARR